MNFEKPAENEQDGKKAAAFSLIIVGVLTLTIKFMMAPTHTIDGINYANVWHVVMSIIGAGLILTGILTVLSQRFSQINLKTLSIDKPLQERN